MGSMSPVQGELQGRLALVTGAGSGIGRGICQVFAREGATVAAVDISQQGMEGTIASLAGSFHKAFQTDVSSSTQISDLFKKIKAAYLGQVPSIVVNCAGITFEAPLTEFKEEMYDHMMNTNLKGTFLVMQAAGKALIDNNVKDGSIINISSQFAQVGFVHYAAYAASKAGQVALIKSAAKEWACIPIRCNAVLPGIINTPALGAVNPDDVAEVEKATPLGRQGQPEEIGEACLFLASTRSSFVTGASFPVSGGLYMC